MKKTSDKKNMKKFKMLLCLGLIAAFVFSPLAPYALSVTVMTVYSAQNQRDSMLAEKEVEIDIPSGKGWYPFVMTFNDDVGFRTTAGEKKRLTILYNFPEFDLRRGCSRIYDRESAYYNSFYGAYGVEGRFGFEENGAVVLDEWSEVPGYDFQKLVLEDLGMPPYKGVFEWSAEEPAEDVEFAGEKGWAKVDASMLVNGVAHRKDGYLRNYIQYGSPEYDCLGEFLPVEMKGRIYGKYLERQDITLFFYVMAKDEGVLKECDEKILSQSVLRIED